MSTAHITDDALRLLYVNSHFQRADMWTGVRARQLVEALTDHGVSVTTFPPSEETPRQQATTTKPLGGLKDFVGDNLPLGIAIWLIEVWLVLGGTLRSLRYAVRAIFLRRNLNADVILIRSQESDWTPWLMGKILGLPVVQEVHSIFYLERSQRRGKPVGGRGGLVSRMEAAQWRSAAGVCVNSSLLRLSVAL